MFKSLRSVGRRGDVCFFRLSRDNPVFLFGLESAVSQKLEVDVDGKPPNFPNPKTVRQDGVNLRGER